LIVRGEQMANRKPNCFVGAIVAGACRGFFIIRLSRGRMMKKWFHWDGYPGLRLLRSLIPGYHLSPLQGWDLRMDVFYRAKLNHH
jgi:hypothetical protein